MKRTVSLISVILVVLALSVSGALAQGDGPASPQDAIGTAFTYQGQLQNGSGPVTGNCDFQFGVWDAVILGAQVGITQTQISLAVNNGLFTTQLDFGAAAFEGSARWLSIAVRCPAGSGSYTMLTPRQALTPAPYANAANRLAWGANWSGSSGTGFTVSGGAIGFYGSGSLYGMQAQATGNSDARGVYGIASATTGFADGVFGESHSKDGSGVAGFNANPSGGIGVFGESDSINGYGVFGTGLVTGTLGEATSTSGTTVGVYGVTQSTNGGYGVYGRASSSQGSGVYGYNATGRGVRGESSNNDGVAGFSSSGSGVYGQSQSGTGLYGSAPSGTGVHGDGARYGVQGNTSSATGYGVHGSAPLTGTAGIATSSNGFAVGVYGQGPIGVYGQGPLSIYGDSSVMNGTGVYGVANNGSLAFGVWGASNTGYAGYFNGKVHVQGEHSVSGTLTVSGDFSASGTKAFKIDHPLDPANQYLYHYAIEAPDVQNLYNGTSVLDAKGEAVVTLPDYFSAVNSGEFRYTLTAIGAPMPNLYIAQEVIGNTFKIAGGVPGKKVSWTVFAQRNDPWLRDHPATDVAGKPANEVGTYLYPQGYGQPASKGVNAQAQKPLGGR